MHRCPRCSQGVLELRRDEPTCITCGYADYFAQPMKKRIGRNPVVQARYIGANGNLASVRLMVAIGETIKGPGSHPRLYVRCLFCQEPMKRGVATSGMAKRKGLRWSCPQRHRIHLTRDGAAWW